MVGSRRLGRCQFFQLRLLLLWLVGWGLDWSLINYRLALFSFSGGFSFGCFSVFSFCVQSLATNTWIFAQVLLQVSLTAEFICLLLNRKNFFTVYFCNFCPILWLLAASLLDLLYDLLLAGQRFIKFRRLRCEFRCWSSFTQFRLFNRESNSFKRVTHAKKLICLCLTVQSLMLLTQPNKVFFCAHTHLLKRSSALVVPVIRRFAFQNMDNLPASQTDLGELCQSLILLNLNEEIQELIKFLCFVLTWLLTI